RSALNSVAVQHIGNLFARQSFEAYKCINVLLLVNRQDLSRAIKRNARVSLDVHDSRNLNIRMILECVLVSAEALIQIWLGRHGEYDHVPFTLELLNQAVPAHQSSLIIISADEKQAPARGRVRVDRYDRNASVNRTVNSVLHCIRIGNRDKNACRPLLDGPEQFVTLGGGLVSIRSGE